MSPRLRPRCGEIGLAGAICGCSGACGAGWRHGNRTKIRQSERDVKEMGSAWRILTPSLAPRYEMTASQFISLVDGGGYLEGALAWVLSHHLLYARPAILRGFGSESMRACATADCGRDGEGTPCAARCHHS